MIFRKCKKNEINVYIMYTLVFIFLFFLAFASFFISQKSLVWSTDGLTQHYPAAQYLKEWIGMLKEEKSAVDTISVIPMWDVRIGEGADFLTIVNVRPLFLMSYFFSEINLKYFFWARVFIGMYISGISFSIFCSLFKNIDHATLLGMIIYAFSGFIMCYAFKHAVFLDATTFFPLLLAGEEKLLKKKSAFLFVLSVTYLALTYFYLLYMLLFISLFYLVIRFLFLYGYKDFKSMVNCVACFAGWTGVALGLSACVFLPTLQLAKESSRVGNATTKVIGYLYDWKYYLKLFSGLSSNISIGLYGFGMVSALAIILLIKLWIERHAVTGRKKQLLIGSILGGVFCCLPIFAALTNAMAQITNRWFFVVSFGAGLLVAFEFDSVGGCDKHVLSKVYGYVIIYSSICLVICFYLKEPALYIVFLLLYLGLFCLEKSCGFLQRAYGKVIVTVLLCVEIGFNSNWFYTENNHEVINQYLDMDKVQQTITDTTARAMEEIKDTSFYRVDAIEKKWNEPYKSRNYGIRNHVNGISTYYSNSSKYIVSTIDELGVSQKYQDFAISSYDQRAVLDTLSCIKYVTTTKERNQMVPFGFKLIKENDELQVYENENALPLIYAYDQVISKEVYDSLEMNEKEQAMLQGAVFETSVLNEAKLKFTDYIYMDENNINNILEETFKSDFEKATKEVNITNKRKSFEIPIKGELEGEIYLRIKGAEYQSVSENTSANVITKFNNNSKLSYIFSKKHQYYNGPKDYIINLGYVNRNLLDEKITVVLNNVGTYKFDSIEVVVQPMLQFSQQVKALKTDVSDIRVSKNLMEGMIHLKSDKVICVAIPYSSGWSCVVDGAKKKIGVVNGRYIGFELEEGEHEVCLMYETPGLYLGIMVTVFSMIGVVVCYGVKKKKKIFNSGSRI